MLEINDLEIELQQSASESPEEDSDEASILEKEFTPIPQRRATRKKNISSSYSSLIPKTREKTSVLFESTIQEPSTIKSDTVFLFDETANE